MKASCFVNHVRAMANNPAHGPRREDESYIEVYLSEPGHHELRLTYQDAIDLGQLLIAAASQLDQDLRELSR